MKRSLFEVRSLTLLVGSCVGAMRGHTCEALLRLLDFEQFGGLAADCVDDGGLAEHAV